VGIGPTNLTTLLCVTVVGHILSNKVNNLLAGEHIEQTVAREEQELVIRGQGGDLARDVSEKRGGRELAATDLNIWLGDDERLIPILGVLFVIVFAIRRELHAFFVDDTLTPTR
jgi:hypothetical protein